MALSAAQQKAINRVKKGIVPVSEASPYVKALIYGKNGKGKTRIAASGPKTLLLDCNEKGTKSIRNYPGVMMYPVKTWSELTYAYWFLKEGNHGYESVVIDTLTQCQNLCMAHVLKNAEDRDPNRPPSMPDRRSWGQLGELMKPIMLNFRNLDMHVVFVCQERVDKNGGDDEDDSSERIVPDLSPSVRGVAMASVEIMGRVYQKGVRRGNAKTGKERTVWETRMLVGQHDDYETKDRTGALPSIMRNPTMNDLIEASASNPNTE